MYTPQDGDGRVIVELLKLPDNVDRLLMLVSSFVMSAIAAMALQSSGNPKRYFFAYMLLYVLCYYPGTAIALRNVTLTGWSRSVFCFAAVPIFALALLVSVSIGFSLIPGFTESYAQGTGPRHGMRHGMVVGAIATVMLYGFYKLMQLVGRRKTGR